MNEHKKYELSKTPVLLFSDIDECVIGEPPCDFNSNCTNIPGSFQCLCESGLESNGVMCSSKFFKQSGIGLIV